MLARKIETKPRKKASALKLKRQLRVAVDRFFARFNNLYAKKESYTIGHIWNKITIIILSAKAL